MRAGRWLSAVLIIHWQLQPFCFVKLQFTCKGDARLVFVIKSNTFITVAFFAMNQPCLSVTLSAARFAAILA